ncbi:TetR/AcrR family transcriptional regulator [Streptomyces hydrogenans]|uniref:TetR/AcrR family transcriptional regulator n=1 Tax=Streptomyces hydrogenans TaxID=1873719 RepID=UPI0035E137F3
MTRGMGVDKTSPQGPRRRRKAEESREVILRAARDLFVSEGYAGVSMRKVAERAGCAPATIYSFFSGKRQILHRIWEEVFEDLVNELDSGYAREADLETLCLTYIDFWLARPDDYRAIFMMEDRPQVSDEGYFVDNSPSLPGLDIFCTALTEAQERGEIEPGDPLEMRSVLLCSMHGVALGLITIPEYAWGDATRLKSNTVRALVRGMGRTDRDGSRTS